MNRSSLKPTRSKSLRSSPVLAPIYLLILLLLITSESCTTLPPSSDISEIYRAAAAEALEHENHPQAVELFQQALLYTPDAPGARYGLAVAYAETGDYEKALELIDGLLKEDPGNIHLRDAEAWIYYQAGNWEVALERYQSIAGDHPSDYSSRMNIARISIFAGNLVQAAHEAEILMELGRTDAELLTLMGDIRGAQQKEQEALSWYIAALVENEDYEPAREELLNLFTSENENVWGGKWELADRLLQADFQTGNIFYIAAVSLLSSDEETGFRLLDEALRRGTGIDSVTGSDLSLIPPELRAEFISRFPN